MKSPRTHLRIDELRVHGMSAAEAATFRKTLEREIRAMLASGHSSSGTPSLAQAAARQILAKLPRGTARK